MKATPKRKASGPAAQKKPAAAAITPNCPRGQQWNVAQKMCLPGAAATPIPIPGTR